MKSHLLFDKAEIFKEFFLEEDENSLKYLPNFNQINIIVGANNSGKSRFLRKLMLIVGFYMVKEKNVIQYNELAKEFNIKVNAMSQGFAGEYKLITLPYDYSVINSIHLGNKSTYDRSRFNFEYEFRVVLDKLYADMKLDVNARNRLYIPTLRSAHSLFQDSKKIEHDIYAETVRNCYDFKITDVQIFTGLHLYKEILKSRNSVKKTREKFERFEDFLSKCFFDGKKVDIVANFDLDDRALGKSDTELILIHVEGESETRKLYDLGDGIQAVIILMYQIYMAEANTFIYIDEPELHLHPGMQRLFLDQLCNNKDLKDKNLTYIITTHSNHFLDLTIEKDNVSIYSFSPRGNEGGDKQFIIKNVNAGDNDLLRNLGVNNSSVFMSNCSIWVEGISDRNYVKAFLKAYINHLLKNKTSQYKTIREDIDYAFYEYAGSNIDHYFFGNLSIEDEKEIEGDINALALHNRILLLADSDNATGKKRERLEVLKASKQGNFVPAIIENIREIENLLTNEIWHKVLIEFSNKNLVKKDEGNISDRIAMALVEFEALASPMEYIGNFLNQIDVRLGAIDELNILNKIYETKADGSFGTFIQKRELSEIVLKKVIDGTFTWETFAANPLIEKLTREIYDFIIATKQ